MPFANCVYAVPNIFEFLIKKRFIEGQTSDITSIERSPLLTCVYLWKLVKLVKLDAVKFNDFDEQVLLICPKGRHRPVKIEMPMKSVKVVKEYAFTLRYFFFQKLFRLAMKINQGK